MYINSPGGVVTSGLSIYDTMEYIKPDVSTVCIGQAASMGSLLLTAGAENKRYCLPNARIMTHQPSGGFQGQASDIEIHAKEIINLRTRLNGIYVKHSGKKIAEIEALMDRDTFLSPEDALQKGLIDEELKPNKVGFYLVPEREESFRDKIFTIYADTHKIDNVLNIQDGMF